MMCACTNDTCWGGCPCGCSHTGPSSAIYYRDKRGFVGGPDPENHDASARRVFVIDPDDRRAVRRLWDALLETADDLAMTNLHSDWAQDSVRDALHEVLREAAGYTPPLEEPPGIGAVVEDKIGTKFVRVADPIDGWMKDRQWQRIGGEINSVRNFGWSDIVAVRVLSEGVS